MYPLILRSTYFGRRSGDGLGAVLPFGQVNVSFFILPQEFADNIFLKVNIVNIPPGMT